MAMIGKVKRMHFREKRSVREIVRLTSLSRGIERTVDVLCAGAARIGIAAACLRRGQRAR